MAITDREARVQEEYYMSKDNFKKKKKMYLFRAIQMSFDRGEMSVRVLLV